MLFKTSYLSAFRLFIFSISNQKLAGRYRYLLKLLSWRMIAARVLFVTHSSSLVIPSGRAPRQRCLGSIFLFTKGMAQPGIYTHTKKKIVYLQQWKYDLGIYIAHIQCSSAKINLSFKALTSVLRYCRKTLCHSYRATGVTYSSQNMMRGVQVHTEDAVNIDNVHKTQHQHPVYCVQRPVSQRTNASWNHWTSEHICIYLILAVPPGLTGMDAVWSEPGHCLGSEHLPSRPQADHPRFTAP